MASGEPAAVPELWAHRLHGDGPGNLWPLRLPRCEEGQSHAAAIVAAIAAPGAGGPEATPWGGLGCVRCTVHSGRLCVEGCWTPLCSLFLAEASYAPLPPGAATLAGCQAEAAASGVVAVALVPPRDDAGLEGSMFGGRDLTEAPCWLVLVRGRSLQALLDVLSRVGCMRDCIEEAYQPSGDDIFGQGAYATVACMVAPDGTPVAVKKMNQDVDFECIEREIAMLLVLQTHPHVVGYRGCFWAVVDGAPQISVVFDAASGGDLLAKVLMSDPFSEAQGKATFHGMSKGVAHIHGHGIVHRDIKAQNILLTRDGTTVVADFGLATTLADKVQMARRCGSPGYVAPEVCLGRVPYGLKVDVFGAGVNLFLMLSKEMPFSCPDRDTAAVMRKTVRCQLHLRRPPWDSFSSSLRAMLRETITKEPDDRLSADEVLQHAWITKAERAPRSAWAHTGAEAPCGPERAGASGGLPMPGMAAAEEEAAPRHGGPGLAGAIVSAVGGYPQVHVDARAWTQQPQPGGYQQDALHRVRFGGFRTDPSM